MVIGIIVSIISLVIGFISAKNGKKAGCAWMTGIVVGVGVILFGDKNADNFIGLMSAFLTVAAACAIFFMQKERLKPKIEYEYEEECVVVSFPKVSEVSNRDENALRNSRTPYAQGTVTFFERTIS
ncbi:MAG: hypothetical protein J5874_02215 [Oscillospiraceae bacterium]|nr:hypothetical protein [Oscillospiraceae bacterium]